MTQRWVEEARRHIGLIEIKGPKHNPEIVAMWKAIKRGGIKDDETPWCASFVGACLERVGIQSTRFEGARSYTSWGEKLEAPVAGCVVVFSRDGGGHVGFVVGQDKAGNLLVLGGNQDDAVNVKSFKRHRATAYRWPAGEPKPVGELPVMAAAEFSKSEA
ncbi:TIGR02594 family protein [Aeromonas veronii]